MDDRIIEKLQKLLALAGSDNEYEAALAMARAEILMRKHNLSIADVEQDGTGATIADVRVEPTGSATYTLWESDLAMAVAWAFHGEVVNVLNGYPLRCRMLHFVAGRTDLVIILDLFERLRQTVRRKSAAYARAAKNAGHGGGYCAGQSYRVGMVHTIAQRLEALRHNTDPCHEVNTHGMSGRDLMVIKDRAVEQRYAELFGDPKEDTRKLMVGDKAAYLRGREDGKNVGLHRSMPTADGRPLAIAG